MNNNFLPKKKEKINNPVIWIDPNEKVYDTDLIHVDWALKFEDMLKKDYNITFEKNIFRPLSEEYNELVSDSVHKLINGGWIKARQDSMSVNFFVKDKNKCEIVERFLLKYDFGNKIISLSFGLESILFRWIEFEECDYKIEEVIKHASSRKKFLILEESNG